MSCRTVSGQVCLFSDVCASAVRIKKRKNKETSVKYNGLHALTMLEPATIKNTFK